MPANCGRSVFHPGQVHRDSGPFVKPSGGRNGRGSSDSAARRSNSPDPSEICDTRLQSGCEANGVGEPGRGETPSRGRGSPTPPVSVSPCSQKGSLRSPLVRKDRQWNWSCGGSEVLRTVPLRHLFEVSSPEKLYSSASGPRGFEPSIQILSRRIFTPRLRVGCLGKPEPGQFEDLIV